MNILFLTSSAPAKAGFSTSEKRPPLGVGYLISVLKRDGHKVYFSDEYLQPTNILRSNFLEKKNIHYVGIYANTICYSSTRNMLELLQEKRKRKKWSGKIMVGGPHTSIGHENIPEYVDYILIGEGEITVPKIIAGEIQDRKIFGEKVPNLDCLPIPAWEEFIYKSYDWSHRWHNSYPLYTMNTSRGCPFNCRFCSVNSIWGKSYRCMSAERIVSDIQYMIRYYGAKGIYFREDHFTLSKKRTIEFCNLLLTKNIEIDWFCETRADHLYDYSYVKLMKQAGCKVFYIGVESGSQRMLDFYKKDETVEQFEKAFDIAKRIGIKTYASFIVGFPTETDHDRNQTEELIQKINPNFVSRNIFIGIPGSELYDYLKDNHLYDFIDENFILYPPGYKELIKKYYSNNPYYYAYFKKYNFKSLLYYIKKTVKNWQPKANINF